MTYPILVERFKADQSMTIVCEACHAEKVITPDDLSNDELYSCPEYPTCPGPAAYKYAEADKCKGCGTLGFYEEALAFCCSRACMFQAEYAEQIKGRAA